MDAFEGVATDTSQPETRRGESAGGPDVARLKPDDDVGPRCLAIMYHYVHDRERAPGGTMRNVGGQTINEFKAQLDELSRTMEPVDWPALYAWMQGRGSIPERCFLLTFDDGLVDHAANVLPVLQERGLRGVFFVPGGVLTGHRMLAAHAIHMLLATLGEQRFEQELNEYLHEHWGDLHPLGSVDDAAAERMYHCETPARAHLEYLLTMALPIDVRDRAVAALFERHVGSNARWARHWYLGWDDLVTMQSLGHTIGGHGFSHESYARLTAGQRRRDMRRVATVLRDGLGSDIRPFSYPYGSFDDDAAAQCQASGFPHAFTTQASCLTRTCSVLQLPRVDTIHVDAVLGEELACIQN